MKFEKIKMLYLQKESVYKAIIKELKKEKDDLIYENQILKEDLDYAKRNGGIKRLLLTRKTNRYS